MSINPHFCRVSSRKNTAGAHWTGHRVEFTIPAGKRSSIVKLQADILLTELYYLPFIAGFRNICMAPKWGYGSFFFYLWIFCLQQLSLKPETPLCWRIHSPFLWVSSFLFSPYSAYLFSFYRLLYSRLGSLFVLLSLDRLAHDIGWRMAPILWCTWRLKRVKNFPPSPTPIIFHLG